MKLILIKDVKKVGKKDDIVEVKDGYAKFLINQNDAVLYTTKSKEILDKQISLKEEQEEKRINEAKKLKKELEKQIIVFELKNGEKGKTFGSVSSKQIYDEIVKLGYKIDKKKIKLTSDLNTIGIHEVEISLHNQIKAIIKINIKSK